MDLKLAYRKTLAGEEALKARAQLRSGRLRAVLIMVDGQATAGELVRQIGKKYRPRDRLAQLERLGLIEPATVHPARPGPSGISDAAAPPPLEPPPEALLEASLECVGESQAESSSEPPAEVMPEPVAEQAAGSAADDSAQAVGPFAPESAMGQLDKAVAAAPVAAAPDEWDRPGLAAAAETGIELPAADDGGKPPRHRWSFRSRYAALESWIGEVLTRVRSRQAAAAGSDAVHLGRAGRRRFGWKTWLGLVVASPFLFAALVWMLLPWDRVRRQIEDHAASVLGQSVQIGELEPRLRPSPNLTLHAVTVGNGTLAQAALVRLKPSLHRMADLARPTVDVEIEGLRLQQAAVAVFCALDTIDPATLRASRVDTVRIAELALVFPRNALAGLHGEIGLNPERGNPTVSLSDADDRLKVDLSSEGKGCRFSANGSGWRVPFGAGIRLDSLSARGTADENGMRLATFDARVSDGVAAGNGGLSWSSRPALDLRLELRHVDVAKLLASLGANTSARGELDARIHLTATAPEAGALLEALAASGPVSVSRGAIDRFDLVEAARSPGSGRVHGGTTQFEQLNAQLQIERGKVFLRNLHLSAGALTTEGWISINGENALQGALTVHLQGAAGQVSIPLRVGGSVAAPELGSGDGG